MGFVVSQGSLRSLNRLPTLPPLRLQLSDTYAADYARIWETQPAVRMTVDFLARNIAQLGLHVYRRKGDADRERLTGHALSLLIEKPNGWTTRYRMLDYLVHDRAIFDRAYLLKIKVDGATVGLQRLLPSQVRPAGDNWMYPEAFEVYGDKDGKRVYPADRVVFFRGYNPAGDVGGMSPIAALRDTLSEAYSATQQRDQLLRNGARASGYLERPADTPWSNDTRDRFRAMWQAQYTGNGPGAGGTPVLEDGMKFVPASQSSKDLQYVESRKLTREEVAAAFFVPPPMLGLLDHATFSNITEQHKMLYQDTLGPWLADITGELALQLVPDMPDSANIYVEFNLKEKLSGDFAQRESALQASVGSPWRTVNEARALDNLPPVAGGDELVRPLNVTQNGDDNPIPAAPADTEPAPSPNGQGPKDGPAIPVAAPIG